MKRHNITTLSVSARILHVSLPMAYKVHWRVVNTDKEAANAGNLRGEFNPSEPDGTRWERTLYRGAHWVEAFVIRTRDGACVGQSERFFVVIE